MRKRVQSSPRPAVHAPVKGPILAYLATVESASTAQICAATRIDAVAVRNALVTLSGPAAQVSRTGVRPRHRYAITARGRAASERMPAAPVRRLPVLSGKMISGGGERRETCERYAQCLDAFVRTQSDRWGHCPTPCPSYAPAAVEGAASYARSGRSSQEAAIFAGWP